MKAAILGTNHPTIDTNPEAILQEAGLNYLQQLVGYVPPTMPVTVTTDEFQLTPIRHLRQATVDGAMTVLCGREVRECNRRIPYLMLVWLLVGSDNQFRVTEYAERDSFICPVAYLLLQMAVGLDIPPEQLQAVVNQAWEPRDKDDDTVWPLWADEAVAWASLAMESEGNIFVKAIETVLWTVTRTAKVQATQRINRQAREWASFDEDEAWLAIQLLLTDIMDFQDTGY